MGYGSVQNYWMGTVRPSEQPASGMGATLVLHSDREPYTIISVYEVAGRKRLIAKRDRARLKPGTGAAGEEGSFLFEPNPEGIPEVFTLRDDGRWVRLGQPMKTGMVLVPGIRQKHNDPSH